ncbi:MAG: DUF937 domain-containing protein [Rikenellaceae bacterium]|nr:DUF937 domain-containing protein [Rikenellaceae bacterium]
MFEKIMDLVKNQVMDKVSGNNDIPEEKKEQTVNTATSSLMDSLKKYATSENLSSLSSMFGGGSSTDSSRQKADSVKNGIQSDMISNLMSKVGLSQGTASSLASGIIPAVMSLFSKKIKDNNDGDFNIGSLLSGLTGDDNSKEKNNVMDMVGNLFGK